MDSRKDSAPLWLAIALFLLLVGGVVTAWIVVFDPRIFPGCDLDQSRWQEARQLVRQGRSFDAFERAEPEVEDIVKCDHLVYGKSRGEVQKLLGGPDSRPGNSKPFYYNVGVPAGLSDYPGLDIRFDPDGRAAQASVSGHIER